MKKDVENDLHLVRYFFHVWFKRNCRMLSKNLCEGSMDVSEHLVNSSHIKSSYVIYSHLSVVDSFIYAIDTQPQINLHFTQFQTSNWSNTQKKIIRSFSKLWKKSNESNEKKTFKLQIIWKTTNERKEKKKIMPSDLKHESSGKKSSKNIFKLETRNKNWIGEWVRERTRCKKNQFKIKIETGFFNFNGMSTLRDITCINKHTRKNCKISHIPASAAHSHSSTCVESRRVGRVRNFRKFVILRKTRKLASWERTKFRNFSLFFHFAIACDFDIENFFFSSIEMIVEWQLAIRHITRAKVHVIFKHFRRSTPSVAKVLCASIKK